MTPQEFHHSRLRLNRTQHELARMLGVTPTSVSRYETGLRQISDTVAILLRFLVERYTEVERLGSGFDQDRNVIQERRRVRHPAQLSRVA